jgi:hypothetical protein
MFHVFIFPGGETFVLVLFLFFSFDALSKRFFGGPKPKAHGMMGLD